MQQPIRIYVRTRFLGLIDWTSAATVARWDYGDHGCRSVELRVPRETIAAVNLYAAPETPEVLICQGATVLWRGHLDASSLEIGPDGAAATIRALGGWQALRHGRHTALWSSTSVAQWRPMNAQDRAVRNPDMYVIDTNNRLFVSLKKSQAYANNADLGSVIFESPDGASPGPSGCQFTVTYNLPANWQYQVGTISSGGVFTAVVGPVTPGAGAGARAHHVTFTAVPKLTIEINNNTGGIYTNAADDGDYYIRVTDLRVVGDTTNRVNTTLTANRAAGSNVTATVGSTAGMYAGMQLVINSGAATSEIVTVEGVTSATQFVATFVGGYTSGQAVQGHRVLASTIARELLAAAAALNPGMISSATGQINATALDLTDAVFEDTTPADVLDDLARRGDGAGQLVECGVDESRRLYFRPKGGAARRWYVRLAALTLERPRSNVANQVYATYDGGNDRTLRTAQAEDAISQNQYSLTRTGTIAARTSNATLAAAIRDLDLSDRATPTPEATLDLAEVLNQSGGRVPADLLRPGDTIIVINLPPSVALSGERYRVFRISEVVIDGIANTTQITPERPTPRVDIYLAQGVPT